MFNKHDYKQRAKISQQLYKGLYSDSKYCIHFDLCNDTIKYSNDVIEFFLKGSKPIYPQKYVFCNIIYSYYLSKYFGVDFYECLDDNEILFDSPMIYKYSDNKTLYDNVIKVVIDKIEDLDSVTITRHYFKQQYLINDEDISDICNVKMF